MKLGESTGAAEEEMEIVDRLAPFPVDGIPEGQVFGGEVTQDLTDLVVAVACLLACSGEAVDPVYLDKIRLLTEFGVNVSLAVHFYAGINDPFGIAYGHMGAFVIEHIVKSARHIVPDGGVPLALIVTLAPEACFGVGVIPEPLEIILVPLGSCLAAEVENYVDARALMGLRPRGLPVEGVHKLFKSAIRKIGKGRRGAVLGRLVEKLKGGGDVGGGVERMVGLFIEKSAFLVLHLAHSLDPFGPFVGNTGKFAKHIEQICRVGTSVWVYAKLTGAVCILPEPTGVSSRIDLVRFDALIYFV